MADVLLPRALMANPDSFGGAVEGDCLRGQPIWREGRLARLEPPTGEAAQMLVPALVEVHCHLDKCHTLPRLGNVGGDLAAAIAAQGRDKDNWTEEDLLTRATKGLAEARMAGCAHLRSHIDWGEATTPPLSWTLLTDAFPEVQWAALTSIGQLADPKFAREVAGHVAATNGVLGAFVLYHDPEQIREGLLNAITEAERLGLMLDFHVDEGLGDYNGLELIADAVIETGFQGPVLCGHAVSLMDRSPDDFVRIADKLAHAGITICALPTTNLYLQGRRTGTPDRRGITRLRELGNAGVRVVVGSDNVCDAFCPTGAHDPMAALHLGLLTAHLDPPLDRWLRMVTIDAAAAIGVAPVTLDGAHAQELRASEVQTTAEAIAGRHALTGVFPS